MMVPASIMPNTERERPVISPEIHVMHVVRVGSADGGMENGIVNVSANLPSERFRISICALDSQETFSRRIHRPKTAFYTLPKKSARGLDWSWVRRLRRLFRDVHVDVVHSHGWGTFVYSVLAAELSGIPLIHGEHGKNFGELNENKRLKDWTQRLLARRLYRLVSVSEEIRSDWVRRVLPECRTLCIPNGVDTARFYPNEAGRAARRQTLGASPDTCVIGSVGRLDPIKDYSLLLRALARMGPAARTWRLVLVGDGPLRAVLEREARELGISDRVYLAGRQVDVENWLRAFDVFVLPSLSEGMSNAVLEAMAVGLPVVCRDLAAHREVIEPGIHGVLLDPCDEDALAGTLTDLVASMERRRELACNARIHVQERFTLDRMISLHAELYSRAVSRS